MPTFKLNGNTYSGSTNYASAIEYIEKDGTKTTVQDKIDEQNRNIVRTSRLKRSITVDANSAVTGTISAKELGIPVGAKILIATMNQYDITAAYANIIYSHTYTSDITSENSTVLSYRVASTRTSSVDVQIEVSVLYYLQ